MSNVAFDGKDDVQGEVAAVRDSQARERLFSYVIITVAVSIGNSSVQTKIGGQPSPIFQEGFRIFGGENITRVPLE